MVRIAGVVLPNKKRMEIALTYIYGVGRSLSKVILEKARINIDKKAEDLTENEEKFLRETLVTYLTEGDLRRRVQENINRLQRISTYRGMRHRRNLPVRGQRTKTNSRTKRGKKVTMGSGKKKDLKK